MTTTTTTTITVTGMTCEHCVKSVTEELSALAGVNEVNVTLATGAVELTSDRDLSAAEIECAVTEAGFELAGH